MIKLGITGGIGSGKSTVSEIFSLCGIPVYIADAESKRLVATSPVIKEELTALFGEDLYKGGILDKALLASLIFSDRKKLEKVNAIIHPEVKTDFDRWLFQNRHHKLVAQEAAILFESGFSKFMDKIAMVYAPPELKIERTAARDNVSYDAVLERIRSQMPDEEKIKLSDFVIVNDGTKSLIGQVVNIIKQLNNLCT
jgi:dephospho-CoA kinase